MKRRSLNQFLKAYSIFSKRRTTIAHAFASALAPYDVYDDARVSEALRFLGQDPDGDLICFYCGKGAETWDHIFALVASRQYAGFGHTLGNLIPCCKRCNSKKGSKDWAAFLDVLVPRVEINAAKRAKLQTYLQRFGQPRFNQSDMANLCANELSQYQQLQERILALMKEADDLASLIRGKVRVNQGEAPNTDSTLPHAFLQARVAGMDRTTQSTATGL
jgi:hypothetical protein